MSKMYIDGVIIVEGKADISWLKSFIDAPIISTNGFDVNDELISYLKLINKDYNLIVMTDPDEAGKQIRKTINSKIDNLINIEVDIAKCNKNHKHGVAECAKEEIIKKLSKFSKNNRVLMGNLTKIDLFSLGLYGVENTSQRQQILKEKYHLGECSNDMFLLKINLLKLTKDDLRRELENGN